uniref:CCHC-type domain-containing protein n=1 Tax=Cajanus cajan TaxID=3821 RepID=A0A151QL19_CAJCA|nr:hypothetical protein KK1_049336 [Cajanus cajan]
MKVEQLFSCHAVSEDRKVSLATLSFQGHAMYWWTSLEKERRINHEPLIQYWNKLHSALRRRHIPPYYDRELMDKLQRLKQRSSSVEEYRKSMELLMMRDGIREEEMTTISRFQSGLNLEIRDKVELLPYRDLNELVQLCSRVEHQFKRKYFRKDSTPSYPKSFKKEGHSSQPSPKEEKEKEKEKEKSSFKASSKDTKTSDIKCFKCLGRGHIASQCPTKKTMILKGQDHYSSLDEATSSLSSDEEEVLESEEEILPCEGDLLLVRRLLNNQSSKIDQSQRENLFQTKCKVLESTCSLIVDIGSTSNCCTSIPISIGKYKEEVLCDIMPLEVSHVLLRRPWQFDKKTIHDGLTNKISFQHLGKKFVWCPLSPSQVNEDQLKLKAKKDEEKSKNKNKKKRKKNNARP